MATSPNYTSTPKSPTVTISTANTNRDGTTGIYGTLMTAGAAGSRVDRIRIQAIAVTTAGMVRLFVQDNMILEIPVQAATPSATNPAWGADVVFPGGLELAAAAVIKAATEKAETFKLTGITVGDF